MNISHPSPASPSESTTSPSGLVSSQQEKSHAVASGMDNFLDAFAGESRPSAPSALSASEPSEPLAGVKEKSPRLGPRAWGTVRGNPVRAEEKISTPVLGCSGDDHGMKNREPSERVQVEAGEEVLSAENKAGGLGLTGQARHGDSSAGAGENERAALPGASEPLPSASELPAPWHVSPSYDFSEVPVHMQDEVADYLDVPAKELGFDEHAADEAQVEVAQGRELKNLSDRHYKMMLLQASGMSRKNIARIFDLSSARVSAITNSGLYLAAMELLRDKIRQHTITRIAGMQDMALTTLQDILMNSEDDKMKLTAVRQILALGDNKPPSRVTGKVEHEHSFGHTVQEAMRVAQERRENLDARTVEVSS